MLSNILSPANYYIYPVSLARLFNQQATKKRIPDLHSFSITTAYINRITRTLLKTY